jgi:predicted RNA-binding protein with RPS1 domain
MIYFRKQPLKYFKGCFLSLLIHKLSTFTKINQFGAFVQLDEYVHGLVHISEIKKDEKKGESLEANKKYKFKILSFEPKEHRLGLSLV